MPSSRMNMRASDLFLFLPCACADHVGDGVDGPGGTVSGAVAVMAAAPGVVIVASGVADTPAYDWIQQVPPWHCADNPH